MKYTGILIVLMMALTASGQQKYDAAQVKKQVGTILTDYEKTINGFVNLPGSHPELKSLSGKLKDNFSSTAVWVFNDLDSTAVDTAYIKMFEYIGALGEKMPKGSTIELDLKGSKIEDVQPNPERNGFTVQAHVKKTITVPEIRQTKVADTKVAADSVSAVDSIVVSDTIMHKRFERLTFHFKLDFFGYTYKGVKVEAISRFRVDPKYLPLTADEEWWINLSDEWEDIFRSNTNLSQFPDNMDFQKIAFIQKLDLKERNVTNLAPLAKVTQLRALDLTNSQITSLEGLEENKMLIELKISGSQVRDLSPIAGLTSLELLYCAKLELEDISAISNLTNMIDLDCSENKLVDIEAVKKMDKLEFLNISLNLEIQSIEPLRGKQNLTKLWMRKMKVTDISAISSCSKMVELDVFSNEIGTLSPLRGLKKMMVLDIAYAKITSLDAIAGLRYITDLNCAGNQITSIEPVSNFYALRKFNCSQTSVSDLSPLYKLEYLQRIDIFHTEISVEEKDRFKKRHPKCKILYY